jgi:predicted TIM-barrel fold metal-dependent hydrolase
MAGDAYAPKHWPDNFVHYINSWGRSKVLFGTDWPVIDPERAVREVDDLNLRPDSWQAMMHDNAVALFKLEDRVPAPVVSGAET